MKRKILSVIQGNSVNMGAYESLGGGNTAQYLLNWWRH
jgi:hypothetical protein